MFFNIFVFDSGVRMVTDHIGLRGPRPLRSFDPSRGDPQEACPVFASVLADRCLCFIFYFVFQFSHVYFYIYINHRYLFKGRGQKKQEHPAKRGHHEIKGSEKLPCDLSLQHSQEAPSFQRERHQKKRKSDQRQEKHTKFPSQREI